jgi:hypothetical protein
MTNNTATKSTQLLDALEGAEQRTAENFAKARDDADEAYMRRVLEIATEQNVSMLKAHQIAQTDKEAFEAYERSAALAASQAEQVDNVRGIASRLED